MEKRKKIPMRMCLGCGQMKPKRELLRVVRAADNGDIRIDRTGKLAGRGAYICKNSECFEKAYKARKLEKALEHRIEPDVYEKLREEINADGSE